MKKTTTFAAIALPLMMSQTLVAAKARGDGISCAPTPPVACNEDACCRTYCLGPENYGVNAAVNPKTCDGDWVIGLSGLYWNAHQEGLEFVIRDEVSLADFQIGVTGGVFGGLYIGAEIYNPNFHWSPGFKAMVGYNTPCDGWDVRAEWTWYKSRADRHEEAEDSSQEILLAAWSVVPQLVFELQSTMANATDAKATWKLELNLADVELGRQCWNSKRLSLRPFFGLRFVSIEQNYDISYKGGTFSILRVATGTPQEPFHDLVELRSDFKAGGLRGGLQTLWHFGCGWALYGDFALSLVYGRFDVDHKESLLQVNALFNKRVIHELSETIRGSRFMTDLALGIQWSSLLCDCKYALAVSLGWEQHLFPNQNPFSRAIPTGFFVSNVPARPIQKAYGDLDAQGVTLSVEFLF